MKTNLEVSKQLKEMGVKQKSEFYWQCDVDAKMLPRSYLVASHECKGYREGHYPFRIFSAFTLSELPEVFRQTGEIKGWVHRYVCQRCGNYDCVSHNGGWYQAWVYHYLETCGIYATKGEEEANAYILEVIKK